MSSNTAKYEAGNTDAPADQSEVSMDKLQDNPYIANVGTNVGAVQLALQKREPLVPRPFKSIRSVIIVSYICYIFLVFPGAIANTYAWEALKYRDLGSYSEAKSMLRHAVRWIYVGFGIGIVIAIILIIVLSIEFA